MPKNSPPKLTDHPTFTTKPGVTDALRQTRVNTPVVLRLAPSKEPTMPSKTKKYTTSKTIAAAFEQLRANNHVRIKFADVRDKVWRRPHDCVLDGREKFVDALGSEIDSDHVAAIVTGRPLPFRVASIEVGTPGQIVLADHVPEGAVGGHIRITAQHVASLEVCPGPTTVKIDGLQHDLVFRDDGTIKVGCQTISELGARQAFEALAKHLDYEVTG